MHTKVYEVTKSCHCVVITCASLMGCKTSPRCPCARFAKAAGLTNPSLNEYSECTRKCTKSPRVVIALSLRCHHLSKFNGRKIPPRCPCTHFAKVARTDQSVLGRILGMHTKVYEVIKSCHCVVTTCANFMGAKPRHAVLSSFCQRSQELSNPSLIEYSECTRKCTKSPRVVIALSLCCHHGLPDSPKSLKVFR